MVCLADPRGSPLSCPVCGLPLARRRATYACDAEHTFDVAREGYVNLMLAQHRHSRHPGDNTAMIDARARFLAAGYYRPVADALIDTIMTHLPTTRASVLVDAGCGEGYYLRQCADAAGERALTERVDSYGVDVSRYAIRRASRQDSRTTYVVGSNHRLPLLDQSTDLLVSHFAPVDPEEFTRVLARDGTAVVGLPGPEHLYGLKTLVYSTAVPHPSSDPLASCPSMSVIASREVRFDLTIADAQHVADLLAMTPFYWSASPATQESLTRRSSLQTPVHIIVNTYRRG